MPRCAYHHEEFTKQDVYRGDGTDQCWLEEVGNFGTAQAPDFRCVFHAPPDIEPIGCQEWSIARRGECQAKRLKALLEEWNAANARHQAQNESSLAFALPGFSCGDINLNGFAFSGDFRCADATFTGKAGFGSEFNGHALFESATFNGDAYFNGANFKKGAEFQSATFDVYAAFSGAHFADAGGRGALFKSATFNGDSIFAGTTFDCDAWFRFARFNGNTFFSFNGCASFQFATFSGNVVFLKIISKWITLHNCRFDHPTSFTKCKIRRLDYTAHTGERVAFNQCEGLQEGKKPSGNFDFWHFTDEDCSRLWFLNMDLSQANFLGANLRDARFDACAWPNEQFGYAKVFRHDAILSNGDRSELMLLHMLYQQLKKNLEDAKNYRQSGDFHYREMEVWQHLLKGQALSLDRAILWLYGFVGDFGENYLKLFASLVLSILLVTGLVTLSEGLLSGNWLATLTQFLSVFPDLCRDGQLGITLLDLATRLFHVLCKRFQEVFFGLTPSPFQKSAFDHDSYHFVTKLLVVIEGLVLATLSVLFVMAIRRRFRR